MPPAVSMVPYRNPPPTYSEMLHLGERWVGVPAHGAGPEPMATTQVMGRNRGDRLTFFH